MSALFIPISMKALIRSSSLTVIREGRPLLRIFVDFTPTSYTNNPQRMQVFFAIFRDRLRNMANPVGRDVRPGSPAHKLRKLREARSPKVTRGSMAAIMGQNLKTVESWERGRSQPKPEAIRKLSEAWGFPLDWFWSSVDTPAPLREAPLEPLEKNSDSVISSLIYGRKCLIRQWRGANAGSPDEDSSFDLDPEDAYEVYAFLVDGKPDIHDAFRIRGESMSPRVEQGDRVIVRYEPAPTYGSIVMVQSPDGKVYLKVLKKTTNGIEFHSVNPRFKPITEPEGWVCKGFAIAIIKEPSGNRGITLEWLEGRPLRP